MKLENTKLSPSMLLALLALVVVGFDGNSAMETDVTKASPDLKSTESQDLIEESNGEHDDQGEGRSFGLLNLHQKRKRTKSSYSTSKPKGQYGAPKAQYGAPKAQYGAPKAQHGPPKAQHGPPKSEYGPPKSGYGPPKSEYGPPKTEKGPSTANYKKPSYNSGSYNPAVHSSSSNNHATYNAASYGPPSYNHPSYIAPSYNPAPSPFDNPQQFISSPQYSTAPLHSDVPYASPAGYEVPAYPVPASTESADDQLEVNDPEFNYNLYAPPSGPEYPSLYNEVVLNYQGANDDSSEDFFSSSNDFPTFDEFLKKNTFNFPNFKVFE